MISKTTINQTTPGFKAIYASKDYLPQIEELVKGNNYTEKIRIKPVNGHQIKLEEIETSCKCQNKSPELRLVGLLKKHKIPYNPDSALETTLKFLRMIKKMQKKEL